MTVFISHAGSNRAEAAEVGRLLGAADVAVRLDLTMVGPGSDFMAFMESALAEADYCLLLWSRAAGDSKWVALEWSAALHRAVSESSAFLIVGRLEDRDLPMLLRPRLVVDLHPRVEPGVQRLIAMINGDVSVTNSTKRPVVKPRVPVSEDPDGQIVYITSRLFGRTFPLRIDLNAPAVAVAERVVTMLGLPRDAPGDHGVGLRFDYGLATMTATLIPGTSLEQQGVTENSVLWLETSVAPFASVEPVRRSPVGVTYRSGPASSSKDAVSAVARARMDDALRARVVAVGLA